MFNTPQTSTTDGDLNNANKYVNRGDLPYDYEDLGMTKDELITKFADTGDHEYHSREDWEEAKSAGRTRVADYWDWVVIQIRKDDNAY